MANYLTTDTDLTAVANAIRTKGGTSAPLAFPSGFVSAVEAIETGGGGGYTLDDFAMRQISGDVLLESATEIQQGTFTGTTITSLSSETVNTAGSEMCSDCKQLRVVNLPNCVNGYAKNSLFNGCSALISVNMPKISNLWSNVFANCSSLQSIVLQSVERLNSNVFMNCTNLLSADFSKTVNIANTYNFNNCPSFSVLVLRSNSVCPLGNTNNFQNSPFASGGSGGKLYVPSSLISSYQSATNWSTILGYANNQILPIEGSMYETQYADGTPIT